MLRCINLLERPQQGRILVAGEELALRPGRDGDLEAQDARQLQRLRTRLSMVFQHFNLWAHMTVLANITEAPVHVLGLPRDEAVERARKYLRLVAWRARGRLPQPHERRPAAARGDCPHWRWSRR